ncbi:MULTISPECIES: NUDIX domain-containing protein [unclassified Nocardioides]|uniref:NUDIX domain-containing protein n=1 Tax=unclassified Nocardioides TaxID=2615069 RepID=UPI0006F8684B|nr:MULTISPECIES: NUDIX hydrolase [unclassified Nocardioides]KQY54542.1 NUDIX hydrolase [Nocardioides sp. Root140]KRF19617.1 NUDIX hydrolase [Nocardioides sp. Soil796]
MTEQPTAVAVVVETTSDGAARISWGPDLRELSFTKAIETVTAGVNGALEEHHRVEAHVHVDDDAGLRVATWSGLRREGVRRDADGEFVVLARLADDPPLTDGAGFRAMLNSFLPRKRAIGQMLVRDDAGRVLMCRLTYKKDWDLPGGVVEVGESPRLATARELAEELGVDIPAGKLLLTDWLPPWSGWDDAVCLVFDGGVHDASLVDGMVLEAREIREAAFLTLDEIQERAADFTHRRVAATLANAGDTGSAYTESGHP